MLKCYGGTLLGGHHIGTCLLLGGVRPSDASSIFLVAICTYPAGLPLCFQSSVYQCMVCTLVRKTNESKVIFRINNTKAKIQSFLQKQGEVAIYRRSFSRSVA